MDRVFQIQIYTPERTFFTGDACSVTVEALDGRLSVLAGHIPMVCSLSPGMLELRTPEGGTVAFHSSGFMDVGPEQVLIFSQACEWPEEIDIRRANEAIERAKKRLKDPQYIDDMDWIKMALHRSEDRLKVREYADKNPKSFRRRDGNRPDGR